MDTDTFRGMVIGFGIMAIMIGIGGTILQSVQQGQCANGAAWNETTFNCNSGQTTIASNATASGLSGIATFGDWLPTIAVIIAAAAVIGIIFTYFRG